MSENSPRWPGSNGSPGLDFSPWRKTDGDASQPADGAAAPEPQTSPAVPTTPVSPADVDRAEPARSAGSPSEPASVSTPDRAADFGGGASLYRSDDSSDSSGQHVPSSGEPTRITPTLSERAASTVRAWRGTPVPGAAAGAGAGLAAGAEHSATPDRASGEVAEATATKETVKKPVRGTRRTRKARLRLARLDPWSVMKTTFLFAIAFGIMLVVATFVIWSVLAGSGAIESTNQFLNTLLGDQDTAFDIGNILSLTRVMGFAAVIAAIDVVIITALATLAAFLYNLAATIMGGLEVTLAED